MNARRLPIRMLAAAAGLAALAPGAIHAQVPSGPDCNTVRTVNQTSNRIWVTIQDAPKWRNLDWGWVDACSYRDWRSGGYMCGSYYHVRAEVKNHDLSANVYDTRVQINPSMTTRMAANADSNTVALRKGATNYYWEKTSSRVWTPDGKIANCDLTPPQGAPQYTINFSNGVAEYVTVTVSNRLGGAVLVARDCVGPGEKKAWKVAPAGEYSIVASAMASSTCPGPKTGDATLNVRPTDGVASAEFGFQLLAK